MWLSPVVLVTILTTSAYAEILTCDASRNAYCGPCTAADTSCTLQCTNAEEICVDSQLQCNTNTDCIINCHSSNACLDATIFAGFVSTLTVNCNDYSSLNGCEGTQMHIGNRADVTINCAGAENSCKDSIVNAQAAGDVFINCLGHKSCSGLYLLCGYGACIIDCSGPFDSYKCDSSSLAQTNTANAHKFQCIGTAAQCLGAPAPFSNPTLNPTLKPSSTPTQTPINTANPSVSPTVSPTFKPTLLPTTDAPTAADKVPTTERVQTAIPTTTTATRSPSKPPTNTQEIVTKKPTNMPTNGPTKTPTNTPKPTIKPTAKPTVSPTDKPTANPTDKPTIFGQTYSPSTVTISPTYKPTQFPTVVMTSTDIPDIVASTTLSPTTPQSDAAMCCECLHPSNSSVAIRGCAVDPECELNICGFDGYCCEDHWDKTCVFYASEQCKKTTPKNTTILISEDGSNLDLNLIWKLALVVFGFMSLFVFCCFILIKFHKCVKSKKTPKGKVKGINADKNKAVTRALSLNEGKKYHDVAVNDDKNVAMGPKVDAVSNKSCPVKVKEVVPTNYGTRHKYVASRSAQLDGIIDGIFGSEDDEVVRKKKRHSKKKKKTRTRSKRRHKTKKRRDTRKRYKKRNMFSSGSDESAYSDDDSGEYEEGISSDTESESQSESEIESESFDDDYDELSDNGGVAEDAVTEIMQSLRRIQSVTKRNSI